VKGNTPWNKGKSGGVTANYVPIGTERNAGDGYLRIKVGDPGYWISSHYLVWERAHGPISEGYVIVFGDGNKHNFDLDNLILVSKSEHVVMNCYRLRGTSAELTRVGKTIAELKMKIRTLKQRKG
jgi:hypothetical protein